MNDLYNSLTLLPIYIIKYFIKLHNIYSMKNKDGSKM